MKTPQKRNVKAFKTDPAKKIATKPLESFREKKKVTDSEQSEGSAFLVCHSRRESAAAFALAVALPAPNPPETLDPHPNTD